MVYLLGGGKGFSEKIAESFIKNIVQGSNITFIPTSQEDVETVEKYKTVNIKWLKEIGITFEESFIIGIDDDKKSAVNKLEKSDVIYLMGGLPHTQLELINKLGIEEKIKEFQGILIGTSAGALNLCEYSITTRYDDYT
ncbi:MAG: hypothetical protein A2Y18_08190 [Clostridiales bacterium GWD2_32_19]|nr:MAG: hypothetical protein A2Y18_08190 [Clostridiales bacterium GWD2_32_19]